MSGVNKVILLGRLGKDPEVKHLQSGQTVANFSIATSESYKDKNGEKKETTEWHNIVLWRGLAEVAEKYLHKGDLVYIEGKLTTRSWEKDGVTRYVTEVLGSNLVMLGSKGQSSGNNSGSGQSNFDSLEPTSNTNTASSTDDLPF